MSVIAASRILRGYAATTEADQVDAVRPFFCFAQKLLCPIAIPTVGQEGNCALVRRRTLIAEGMCKIKQEINDFPLPPGIEEPASLTIPVCGQTRQGTAQRCLIDSRTHSRARILSKTA